MVFCKNCGTKIEDGVKFCSSCGAPIEEAEPVSNQQPDAQDDFSAKLAGLNNTADTTADFEKSNVESNKVMGILAYLSWLVLIPIFAAKESKFAKFHANQGLVLAITEIVWWIVEGILTKVLWSIFGYNLWRLWSLLATVLGLVNIVFLVLAVIGILNVINGRAKELPVIGKFKILK